MNYYDFDRGFSSKIDECKVFLKNLRFKLIKSMKNIFYRGFIMNF